MASKVSGIVEQINISGTNNAIASTAYGYCETAAAEPAKVVDMTDFKLYEGVTIHVKFKENNSAANPTLNVQDTGAKPIVQYGTTAAGKTNETNGWYAGAVITLTYDGTSWVRDQGFNSNSTYSYMRPYGSTASATAAKTGTAGWKFQLTAGKYFMFTQYYDNTAQSALTLNIGSTGAKPIYINGQPSSSTNYTLPGGQYLVYYDGTNYHFRTDDKIPGNIAGDAATASSVALSGVTDADNLKAIEAVSGTSGLLKKTGTNTWTLDNNTYLTSHRTYTAFTGKPTGNQTPGFGDTVTIQQISQSATGQVSGTDRTITIPSTAASASTAGLVNTDAQTFAGVKTFDNGIEIKGHIAGDSGTSGHGLWGGGGYHNAYNNIILHGDATTGTSGIAFISDKGTTTINQPSDRAFIQWHAHGVTTYSAEGTNPTLATSGESNILMIGVGNDGTDQIRLQTPGRTGLLHQVGNTGYVIPDTNNTTGSVGGTTTPVYVDAGVIKPVTLKDTANALINALDTGSSPLTANDYVITQYVGGGTTTTTYHRRPANQVVNGTLVKAALGTVGTTAKKFLKDTGNWVQVDWDDLTGKPSTETLRDTLFPVTTYTKTVTLTTEWQDVGITGADLNLDGTYIIQLYLSSTGTNSLGSYYERYSGIMSWYKSITNSGNADEIVLHRGGHAPNGNCIYLRVQRSSASATPNTLRIQIKASKDTTVEATLKFKFRWILD